MKHINIFSLSEYCENFEEEEYEVLFNVYGLELKTRETYDLINFVKCMDSSTDDKKVFDMFYVGYKIPQIGKEFDLIRVGNNSIVNIELKSESTFEKIKNQLARNKYYMNHIDRKVFYFTFESKSSKLYQLSEDDILKEVNLSVLIKILESQRVNWGDHPNQFFDPTRYLVSPFNSTKKFLRREYFLTNQQEDIKRKILHKVRDDSKPRLITISGAAGTGKTLLLYDIVYTIKSTCKVLLIHCANLNSGHLDLKQDGWSIIPIKRISDHQFSSSDIIVVDESQRLKKEQLIKIVTAAGKNKNTCIFSYDQRQTLSSKEENTNIDQYLKQIKKDNRFKLSRKIRSNQSVANFILSIFDLSFQHRNVQNQDSLELLYFSDHKKVDNYLSSISDFNWKILGLTPSSYTNDSHSFIYSRFFENSHSIIGQEFDNVVVIIDKYFDYKDNKLIYNGQSYYKAVNMLFQNMTRARKKLVLLFVNNKKVFQEALSLLKR